VNPESCGKGTMMAEQSEFHAGKIALIGLFGTILTTAAALTAIVLYFAMSARVEKSRERGAAERIARRLEQIKAGRSPGQPWLDADLQYAAQEAALGVYAARTIKEEDGAEQIRYSMPIEQAIEAVLKERGEVAETNPGEPSERSCSP